MISISWFSALVVGHLVLFLLSLLGHVGVGPWCTVIFIICCCALVVQFSMFLLGVGPSCTVISITCCSTLVAYFCFGSLKYFVSLISKITCIYT